MPILLLQQQYRELFPAIKAVGSHETCALRRGIAQQISVLLLLGAVQGSNPKVTLIYNNSL